eukprot:TRINITY_DN27803_c0_g1_i1.p1 TRINITY_DN27803_c0_g1~~TRINITY_DN27803_c0_g1_i1.p1  ORF type:complete len:441 (+),score=47.51 TRINITY_DN27803_c0_g1_i1:157-1479(+)
MDTLALQSLFSMRDELLKSKLYVKVSSLTVPTWLHTPLSLEDTRAFCSDHPSLKDASKQSATPFELLKAIMQEQSSTDLRIELFSAYGCSLAILIELLDELPDTSLLVQGIADAKGARLTCQYLLPNAKELSFDGSFGIRKQDVRSLKQWQAEGGVVQVAIPRVWLHEDRPPFPLTVDRLFRPEWTEPQDASLVNATLKTIKAPVADVVFDSSPVPRLSTEADVIDLSLCIKTGTTVASTAPLKIHAPDSNLKMLELNLYDHKDVNLCDIDCRAQALRVSFKYRLGRHSAAAAEILQRTQPFAAYIGTEILDTLTEPCLNVRAVVFSPTQFAGVDAGTVQLIRQRRSQAARRLFPNAVWMVFNEEHQSMELFGEPRHSEYYESVVQPLLSDMQWLYLTTPAGLPTQVLHLLCATTMCGLSLPHVVQTRMLHTCLKTQQNE